MSNELPTNLAVVEPTGTVQAIANSVMLLFQMLSTAQQTHLNREHQEAIEYYNFAKNAQYPNYAGDRRTLAKEKRQAFELAFNLAVIDRIKELRS